MKVLVIGGGGREHAIVHALVKRSGITKIWCAPGNAGISQEAECVPIQSDDLPSLVAFARNNKVDLTVVGPEAPLVQGIVDHFRNEGFAIVGPTKSAARLEGSKSFAKEFMSRYGIPTARYEVIPNLQKGAYQLKHWKGRSVVKADGLAAGKGVKVCESETEAKEFLYQLMEKEIFGAAGSTVLIEECLEGEEATIMAFCDGKTLVAMPASQDHKRLSEGDQGPNTGGMGAYAPAPVVTPSLHKQIEKTIFEPFLKGIQREKFDYRGIIYFGLMITKTGPKVLEFNVRFGDPETQVVLPLLATDLLELFSAISEQRLADVKVRWEKKSTICVVLASYGYPGTYDRGKPVDVKASALSSEVMLYHAGTLSVGGEVQTAGGRVLGVSAIGDTFEKARESAYRAISQIHFEGMIFRKDIGIRALALSGRSS